MIELTAQLEAMYLHHVIQIPLYQGVSYTLYAENLILPVDEYVPALGWGVRFADIDPDKRFRTALGKPLIGFPQTFTFAV
jgi:hypothetical protein